MARTGTSEPPPPNADGREDTSLKKMTLLQHLEELRRRLLWSAASVAVVFGFTLYFCKEIFQVVVLPLTRYLPKGATLVYLKLQEPFTVYLKVALVAALFFSAPFILYQIWLFIAPGLYRKEKRYAFPFILFATVLFVAGCAFAYFIAFPACCKFFVEIGQPYTPNIDMDFYYDLVLVIVLGMGIVFQMPVVITVLSMMGLVTPKFLVKKLRHAIVIIFVVAAVVSPTTDAVNLFIFALPMVALYALSIIMAFIFAKKPKPV